MTLREFGEKIIDLTDSLKEHGFIVKDFCLDPTIIENNRHALIRIYTGGEIGCPAVESFLLEHGFAVYNTGEELVLDENAPIPAGHHYHGRLSGYYAFRVFKKKAGE